MKNYGGIASLNGKNIKTGFQVSYLKYNMKPGRHLIHGFGYCLSYYKVRNVEGALGGLDLKYSPCLYLSNKQRGIYLSGGLILSFGPETIKHNDLYDSHFFIGPTIEENIGISISDVILLEAGLFQQKHFGSKILLSDTGYQMSVKIRIK